MNNVGFATTASSQITNSSEATQNNNSLSRSEKCKNIAIRALKISVVALTIIVCLGAAAASIYSAIPLFVAGGWAIVGGLALSGAALGCGIGVFMNGILVAADDERLASEFPIVKVNTPMFKITQHNVKDCIIYLGKALGTGAFLGISMGIAIPFLAGFFVITLGIAAKHPRFLIDLFLHNNVC